jgi:hypothetical protein
MSTSHSQLAIDKEQSMTRTGNVQIRQALNVYLHLRTLALSGERQEESDEKKTEKSPCRLRHLLSVLPFYFFSFLLLFAELASETLLHKMVKAVAEGFELHLVDDLVDKGVLKEELGFLQRDASLSHIEESGIVELTNGRAMSTLHVVSIDFEHWLCIHAGLFSCCQILIGHLRRSLLSTMLYQDTTSECTCCLIIKDILIQFVRGAMRHFVSN